MKPERESRTILGITRSQAKMYEYNIPKQYHIAITPNRNPEKLFSLSIGLLGDFAAKINVGIPDLEILSELRRNLRFSAYFFDSYFESRLNLQLSPYFLLLGSASYYLCDLPGSSKVLADRINENEFNLGCFRLENLLLWILKGNFHILPEVTDGLYKENINRISQYLIQYFESGNDAERLFNELNILRRYAYADGTPRELLFTDIICAISRKHLENSSWYCLPHYSELSKEQWLPILQKKTFIQEFWPAQRLLGEHGVFRGVSAIVQMPTSAGKTRAIEIIIRSAFFSGRTSLAVIIAPFKALCHEIKDDLLKRFENEAININELSDVMQFDFEIEAFLQRKQILVLTPEKFVYMLRQVPDFAKSIGLLIYDEGHMFDSGSRGVTYELLLTSLKNIVSDTAQTILISAVISNAEAINSWLNGGDSQVIFGTNLSPTYRTLAFTSWVDTLGKLEFVNKKNFDEEEFFVPRVIEQYKLKNRPKESKERLFPERDDGRSVALYLGLRLVSNGSVAIFCGTKVAAAKLCEKVVELYDRGFLGKKPIDFSDKWEAQRFSYLYERNLGKDAIATQAASLGVFSHHANVPHGIRLAVEHGMKTGSINFVACTSTLAQGVNLPIRYLIVTSIYQGMERIKVRDFHNLIGRAGRSGMHTEGSIIFADPEVYDKRKKTNENYQWVQVKELFKLTNSEPCASSLLSIFEPLYSDDSRYTIRMEPLTFTRNYVDNPAELKALPAEFASEHKKEGFTRAGLEAQISRKIEIIASIENYLMAHLDDFDAFDEENDGVSVLTRGTLAYFLSSEENRKLLIELFKLLANNIKKMVPDVAKRRVFAKTMYSVRDSLVIELWVNENIDKILNCSTQEDLFETIWPAILQQLKNQTIRKLDPAEAIKDLAYGWIQGIPFITLYEGLIEKKTVIKYGSKFRDLKIEHIVDICENALSYEGMLVVGAITEFFILVQPNSTDLVSNLQELQKRMKYGVMSSSAIALYEMGFADRAIATDLSAIVGNVKFSNKIISAFRRNESETRKTIDRYPAYFRELLNSLL